MQTRILAIAMGRCFSRTVEGNRTFVAKALKNALQEDTDLVCLPEAFTAKGVPVASVAELAEPVPGPTTDFCAAIARAHRCYLLCPIYTVRDGVYRNSAVLIGRAGEILGIYDKRRPWSSSEDYSVFECGVSPGETDGVFDLDFGRVGVRICSDVHFPEDWSQLAAAGVKAVFWPSAFNGGPVLQGHAVLNHTYLVAAVRTDKAAVINPCGRVLVAGDRSRSHVAVDIDLDFLVARTDIDPGLPKKIERQYADRVRIETFRDDCLFLLESTDPSLTPADVRAQMGFETAAGVIERHARAYRGLNKSAPARP